MVVPPSFVTIAFISVYMFLLAIGSPLSLWNVMVWLSSCILNELMVWFSSWLYVIVLFTLYICIGIQSL